MQIAFVVVAVAGLMYFSFAERRFDFFSVAFYSACVYFLPGFFGYANSTSGTGQSWTVRHVSLVPETYLVFLLVLMAILLAAIAMDSFAWDSSLNVGLPGSENAVWWATGLGIAGFLTSLITAGDALLLSDKSEMMQSLGRPHLIWATAASLGFVLSLKQRRWWLLAVCGVLLLIDVYVGFRASLANATIAAFVLWLSEGGRQRFVLKNWKLAAAGAGLAAAFFLYKQIYINVKLGMWERLWDRFRGPDLYVNSVANSEPFTIQAILNGVLKADFHTGIGHFRAALYELVPFYDPPIKERSFNALFQPALFPQTSGGMANNIWAEMWSSGGWPLLVSFVVVFVLLMAVGSYLLRAWDPAIAAGAALLFSYWAFYLHRNDLLFQTSLTKNLLVLWGLCVILSIVWRSLTHRIGRSRAPGEAAPRKVSEASPE